MLCLEKIRDLHNEELDHLQYFYKQSIVVKIFDVMNCITSKIILHFNKSTVLRVHHQ